MDSDVELAEENLEVELVGTVAEVVGIEEEVETSEVDLEKLVDKVTTVLVDVEDTRVV